MCLCIHVRFQINVGEILIFLEAGSRGGRGKEQVRDGLQVPVPGARGPLHQVQDRSDGARDGDPLALLRLPGKYPLRYRIIIHRRRK